MKTVQKIILKVKSNLLYCSVFLVPVTNIVYYEKSYKYLMSLLHLWNDNFYFYSCGL